MELLTVVGHPQLPVYSIRYGEELHGNRENLSALAKQCLVLPATDIGWKNTFRKVIYEVIPNRRYVDGVIVLVRGIYESCRELGIDFRSDELGDWLMFQQVEKEYPVRNITLKQGYEFHIATISCDREPSRVVIKPTVPKNYRKLLVRSLKRSRDTQLEP